MKLIKLLIVGLLLSGCMTTSTTNKGGEIKAKTPEASVVVSQGDNPSSPAVVTINTNGTIVVSTGSAYENKNASIVETFKATRYLFILGILCSGLGVLVLSFSNKYSNKIGWGLICLGGAVMGLGALFPVIQTWGIVLLLIAVTGAIAWLYTRRRTTGDKFNE